MLFELWLSSRAILIQFFCHYFFCVFLKHEKHLLPLKDKFGEKNPIQIGEKFHSF